MNSNIDLANFDKMLELAEFGAKRHNERRQNYFRVIIAYITLLALALYQTIKNENELGLSGWEVVFVTILLLFVHYFYLKWLWATLIASINDVRRRDFYLKKAESLSYHLSRNQFSDFYPNPSKYVKINFGSGASWKITERCLFKMRGPKIIGGSFCEEPPPPKYWRDIHFKTLAIIPTVILLLLIAKLIGILWTTIVSILVVLFLFIAEFSGKM